MNRRRKHGEDHAAAHADERWLITYADMITLLLAVFIVLFALSDTNQRKFAVFAQSLSRAFNTDVFRGTETITISEGMGSVPGTTQFDSATGILATDYRTVAAMVQDYAISQGLAGEVSVERVPEGIAIRISDTLLFRSGRARLDAASEKVLAKIERIVAPLPNALRIEGHTDDLPPTGPFYEDNWQLSTARALAVLNELSDLGIAPERLAAAGYAAYRPLTPNSDDAARARNRRVDILILYSAELSSSPTSTDPPFTIGNLP